MSDSATPLQHARLLCPPLFPGVCENSCLLNVWCYLTITTSSSAALFSFCLQFFPETGCFPMSQLFTSGGQSIRASSGQISFRIDWLDLLAVQGTLKSLLQHHSSRASVLLCSAFFVVQLSHPYMTTGPLSAKWCLCFLIPCLGLSWLFFQGATIF